MKKFFGSFYYAIRGIVECLKSERNFRFHLFAAVVAVVISFWLKISALEWALVILSITIVMAAEIINTSVEKIADFIEPNINKKIRVIKDMTAGMTLIAAIGAFLVGVIIFLPKIISGFSIFFNIT